MGTSELNNAMQAKLASLGFGFESLKVFGTIRQNVHVVCISRNTADKWAMTLATIFKGGKITCTPTTWEAAENKNTTLRPTMRKGWLVTAAG